MDLRIPNIKFQGTCDSCNYELIKVNKSQMSRHVVMINEYTYYNIYAIRYSRLYSHINQKRGNWKKKNHIFMEIIRKNCQEQKPSIKSINFCLIHNFVIDYKI